MAAPTTFTYRMLDYYEQGQNQRQRLVHLGNKISTIKQQEEFPHMYIYSVPGLGKTHTVNSAMQANNVKYYTLSGNLSMFAFGVQLAVIRHLDPNSIAIISVDDCDEILKNETNINIMKNVLEGNRMFHYQKHVENLLATLDNIQRDAVIAHQQPGVSGFVVPTDNMIFVFTANERLPYDDEVNKSKRSIHLNAIRSRCRVYDFDMEDLVQWGWIADVALNTNCISLVPQEVIEQACKFMFEHWSSLRTKSIRTIKMMCDDYKNSPNNFTFIWEKEYIK